jgi:DNA-binding LacI/PurR family transcriptional regulator
MNANTRPKTSKRRVQMIDIARLAGVSVSTVSRALSGSPLTNEATRNEIISIAQREGYTVNVGATQLRTGNNRTVAVVVPYDPATRQHLSDPFFLAILGRLADALTDRGYEMLLSRVPADALGQIASVYTSGKALGIIMIGQWQGHEELNALQQKNIPFAVWGEAMPVQNYSVVGTDNAWGGYIATRHLLARGRRHVFFLGDPSVTEVTARYEGFEKAMREAGQVVSAERVIASPFVADMAEALVHQLVDRNAKVDGIVCASDLLAISAINALQLRGWDVPGKVAVTGYDDIPLAKHINPALTTVAQPLNEGARALIDAMLASVNGEPPSVVRLETNLVVRQSA